MVVFDEEVGLDEGYVRKLWVRLCVWEERQR